ncbi:MAG: NAD(P)-binding domain-containing protein [Eubacterium sp.]|nr:NAD(P)-binding domain-containing protein [Eubacterium sp.]
MKIGIIGYGSMGKMLLWKFSESGLYDRDSLLVANRTIEKLDETKGIATICSNTEVAEKADIVFVCVRPADMKNIFSEIADSLKESALLVSLNGNIRFDMIKKVADHKTAKVIPSVMAEINKSQTIVCYNDQVEQSDKDSLKKLLSIIGNVIELPEDEVGMGSELVSCMPGFIASIFDVICTTAEGHTSIPRADIVKMVLNTLCGTGDLMLTNDMSFQEVVERVATKGGITEEGTKVVYSQFPETAEELFNNTLEKRRIIAEKARESFV